MIEALDGHTVVPEFDWYQFSTQTDIRSVKEILQPLATAEPFHNEKPKLAGYAFAFKTGGRGGSVLVHYGGRNGDNHGPNIAGTGPLAPVVAELFRATKLPHGVGRADVRLDFLGDFEKSRLLFIDRCNQTGMASTDAGSCPESSLQLGRTVYGGSKSSFYQPTLYQKGLQLGPDYPENYLRLEHRFAPTKATEKKQLAELSPFQMVGLRPVARDLSQSIASVAIAPYKLTKYPAEKNAYHWMLTQYQGLLWELHEDAGSDECAGKQIFHDLREMRRLQHA